MRIMISGATGFIGKHLCAELLSKGDQVTALSRDPHKAQRILGKEVECLQWDGQTTNGWQEAVEGTEVLINLAGENLSGQYWTDRFKQKILESRVNAGKAMVEAVERAKNKPNILIQASGIGIYGSRGEEMLDETSEPGSGFIAEVVKQWESSVEKLEEYNIRCVFLRSGVVLGRGEGMLDKISIPFKLFIGGFPGTGRHWFSWIHIKDQVTIIRFLIKHQQLTGLFNVAAPNPVRFREFTNQLGKVLHRPSWIPVPSPVIKLTLGEMADEMVFASQRAYPKRLEEAGYQFLFPTLKDALQDLYSE